MITQTIRVITQGTIHDYTTTNATERARAIYTILERLPQYRERKTEEEVAEDVMNELSEREKTLLELPADLFSQLPKEMQEEISFIHNVIQTKTEHANNKQENVAIFETLMNTAMGTSNTDHITEDDLPLLRSMLSAVDLQSRIEAQDSNTDPYLTISYSKWKTSNKIEIIPGAISITWKSEIQNHGRNFSRK